MKSKTKITAVILAVATSGFLQVTAQSWSITGNAGISAGINYLGTSDPNDLVIRSNAIERGRVLSTGEWRFGTATNNATIDVSGRLSFNGTGVYQVAGNKYAFQYKNDPDYGLFFNSTDVRYDFRNGTAQPVFFINAATGAISVGNFATGVNYILPATRGTNNQILKTDGAGNVSWSADNNTAYTAGTGLSLVGTTFNNTAPDQVVSITGSNGITTSGAYPNFTINGNGLWRLSGNSGTNPATSFIGTTDASGFAIRTNNLERIRIGQDGRTGFGTTSPTAWLHVNAALNEDALRIQTNGTTRLFIDNTGGVSIGSLTPGPAGGLFVNGNIGAGTAAPTDRIHIAGDATGITFDGGQYIRDITGAGFSDIEIHANFVPDNTNSHSLGTSTNEWTEIWAIDGSINLTSRSNTKNVKELPYGLKEIMKLKPVIYNRANNPEGGDGVKRLGLIAEDVKSVVPEAVRDWVYENDETTNQLAKVSTGQNGISLTAVIPVLIKALQEQQAEIEELKKLAGIGTSSGATIAAGNQQVNEMNVKLSPATLDQNVPNPLKNITTIHYNIPVDAKNVSLIITDINGRMIKQLSVKSGSGVVNVDASLLNNGTYNYTLIVDGIKVETKKMIIAK